MNSVAIICEYNPFHTGHAYHIGEARRLSGADNVLGIMSGFFVQRAEPAVFLPQTRAAMAIRSGMDAIIELPVAYSVASAQRFAEGAINVLSGIPSVKYVAMGVEDDPNILQRLTQIQCEQSPAFCAALHRYLESGLAYPAALTKATLDNVKDSPQHLCEIALRKPNNILAIEYLKALKKAQSDIRPIFIPRRGNGYNDTSDTGEYISATAARILIYEREFEKLRRYIPQDSFILIENEFENQKQIKDNFELLMAFALRQNDLSTAPDCSEGLDIKLSKVAKESQSLDEIISKCVSKRYTASRLKRIALQSLIGITKKHTDIQGMGRLIALSEKRKDLMHRLPNVAKRNSDYAAYLKGAKELAELDDRAADIYALITKRSGNLFWNRKPEII